MIGIFDSGSGGLSVLCPLRRSAPSVDIVYFADIAHLPYGDKTLLEIDALTYAATQKLLTYGATQIVNACNTVSASLTFAQLGASGVDRNDMIEMIGPTLGGVKSGGYAKIAIVATRATIRSGAYQRGLDVLQVAHYDVAAPELVPAIESGASPESIKKIIDGIVDSVMAHGCDALLLGCTHFPLVRNLFELSIYERGAQISIIDPAEFVVSEALKSFDLRGNGTTRFILSKDSSIFREKAQACLGAPIDVVVEL